MVEVTVFTEGQTEEGFIKQVVAPSVRHFSIFVKPLTLNTSKDAKGGAVNYDRLKFNARNTLRQKPTGVLTTFLDLYELSTDFPGYLESKIKQNVFHRVSHLEDQLHLKIVEYVGCEPERFKSYIQPYEFEGLLFSSPESLVRAEPGWDGFQKTLEKVKGQFESPEHINDGFETKPSARLTDILKPAYKKTRHGPIIAKRIGLDVLERECVHFHLWMDWLRGLSN